MEAQSKVQHGNARDDFKLSPGKNIFKAQFTCVFHRVGVGGGNGGGGGGGSGVGGACVYYVAFFHTK